MTVVGDTGDGATAVELCRQKGCDLLVMDLVLSTMDGVEVLTQLGELPQKPKVLILSGFAGGSVAELTAAKGADYFMMKPCRTAAVVERVLGDRIAKIALECLQIAPVPSHFNGVTNGPLHTGSRGYPGRKGKGAVAI